ncbi:MAG: nucleotide-binding domain-containing protein [Armatimonadota bacterium]
MATESRSQLSLFLRYLAESLDISDADFQLAKEHYEAVARWLGADGSPLAGRSLEIYPQGSFRLGTVVRPVTENDEYDIDLLCQLAFGKNEVTQKQLKNMVGHRLMSHGTYAKMLDPKEGRRSWRLNHADGLQFHMDICPAIPGDDSIRQLLLTNEVPEELAEHAIAITDKEHRFYDSYCTDWLGSNPKGYAEWFKSCMQTQFDAQRLLQARNMEASVERVPEHKIKTPLQRAIQILKRHRDVMFTNDSDDRPISIIITTLAAQAYSNEADLLDSLLSIVDGMPAHIEERDGVAWVPNPSHQSENFADRWKEHPQRERKFREWLLQVREDIDTALTKGDVRAISASLKSRFGERGINEALKRFPSSSTLPVRHGAIITQSLARFNVSHRQRPSWPVVLQGWVKVTGWASRSGFRPWQIRNDISPLSKHCSLRFEAQTNIIRPYKVYWQVVNTGNEARLADCLRGEFYDGILEKGELVRKERTLYSGMHWVQCFIVKDGVCVAHSGEHVVNIR